VTRTADGKTYPAHRTRSPRPESAQPGTLEVEITEHVTETGLVHAEAKLVEPVEPVKPGHMRAIQEALAYLDSAEVHLQDAYEAAKAGNFGPLNEVRERIDGIRLILDWIEAVL
jgi:hypothetical protein